MQAYIGAVIRGPNLHLTSLLSAIRQSTKLKEQEKTNQSLLKEKEQLQLTVQELKARIREGECYCSRCVDVDRQKVSVTFPVGCCWWKRGGLQ